MPYGPEADAIKAHFPKTWGKPAVRLVRAPPCAAEGGGLSDPCRTQLRVGIVLSGGQAPGGHNVIGGLLDSLMHRHPGSRLYGFLDGPRGIMERNYKEITVETMVRGFEGTITKRGRVVWWVLGPRALCVWGMCASVSFPCVRSAPTAPFLITHSHIPLSLPFHSSWPSATRAASTSSVRGGTRSKSRPTWPGRLRPPWNWTWTAWSCAVGTTPTPTRPSHVTLECALQTHPQEAIICEEVDALSMTLADVTNRIADIVAARSAAGKDYGVVLLPEGLIEHIPQMRALIHELNDLMADGAAAGVDEGAIAAKLGPESGAVFAMLPPSIRSELLLERDPHGNVQVSRIETEKLIQKLVETELEARKAAGLFKGKFACLTHFLGYEGRCSLVSFEKDGRD